MRYLILFIILILSSSLKAQSYYFYNYNTNNKDSIHSYKSLLIIQEDGSAIARVQYKDEKGNLFLYEVNLTDSSLDNKQAGVKFLMPTTTAKPLLDADIKGFMIPRFIFKKVIDTSGNYYEPSGIEINISGKWEGAKFFTYVQKTFEDLKSDEDFVNSFYFTSDPFYNFIFDETTRAIPLPRKEKMFLLIVANTNDATVGESAATDFKNVKETFIELAQSLGILNIYPVYIKGDNYSKLSVEAALARIEKQKPGPDDMVIFYFSGHGFRLPNQTNDLTLMSFRTATDRKLERPGDYISLEEVNKRILKLNTRFSLVLADCCNANFYDNPVVGNDAISQKGGGTLGTFNLESGTKLFFPPIPLNVLIGSVHKGHLSVGHPDIGGYFTHFFLSELKKNLWGYFANAYLPASPESRSMWLSMGVKARENTYWKAKGKQCGATQNDRCIQEADIFVNQIK